MQSKNDDKYTVPVKYKAILLHLPKKYLSDIQGRSPG